MYIDSALTLLVEARWPPVICDPLQFKCIASFLPQIDHMVKGHTAYTQLQEQVQQRSADAFNTAVPNNAFAHL